MADINAPGDSAEPANDSTSALPQQLVAETPAAGTTMVASMADATELAIEPAASAPNAEVAPDVVTTPIAEAAHAVEIAQTAEAAKVVEIAQTAAAAQDAEIGQQAEAALHAEVVTQAASEVALAADAPAQWTSASLPLMDIYRDAARRSADQVRTMFGAWIAVSKQVHDVQSKWLATVTETMTSAGGSPFEVWQAQRQVYVTAISTALAATNRLLETASQPVPPATDVSDVRH